MGSMARGRPVGLCGRTMDTRHRIILVSAIHLRQTAHS